MTFILYILNFTRQRVIAIFLVLLNLEDLLVGQWISWLEYVDCPYLGAFTDVFLARILFHMKYADPCF